MICSSPDTPLGSTLATIRPSPGDDEDLGNGEFISIVFVLNPFSPVQKMQKACRLVRGGVPLELLELPGYSVLGDNG